jgi:phage terminase large subunit
MQDHTADSIKSLEGFRIAWVDEAQNLSARSLSLLRPTIRTEASELWASWNALQLRLMRALESRARHNG